MTSSSSSAGDFRGLPGIRVCPESFEDGVRGEGKPRGFSKDGVPP